MREFLKINYDCHLGISRQIFHHHFLQSKENSKLKLTVHSPCLLTKVSLIQFPMSGKHSAILCQESSKSGCLSSILPPGAPHILPAFARPPRPSVPTLPSIPSVTALTQHLPLPCELPPCLSTVIHGSQFPSTCKQHPAFLFSRLR